MLVGASGKAGRAVHKLMSEQGHEILTVGRNSGEFRYDISEPSRLDQLWAQVGPVDAVVSTAGEVPYGPIGELNAHDYQAAFSQKALSQINLVHTGLRHIAPRGSFTLVSGIPSRDPIISGAAAAMANGAVEAFARVAAVEIAPRRINVVSPSVFTESLDDFGAYFPGFPSVDLVDVAQGFRKAIEGASTGQVITLP